MDQLDNIGRDRKARKSISEIQDTPRPMSLLRLGVIPNNPLDGSLW
jgi:hypothetical protein